MLDYIDDTVDGLFSYFLINKLRVSDRNILQYDADMNMAWPIDSASMWTIVCKDRINYVSRFREYLYGVFKKLNLNAVIGTMERHPNRKGLHAHVIMFNVPYTEIRYKSLFFHQTIGQTRSSLFNWIDYMFKDLSPHCVFSNQLVYGTQCKIQEKGTEETIDKTD